MQHDYAEKKDVDFYSYGKVIHSGWGNNPTQKDEAIVADIYKTL